MRTLNTCLDQYNKSLAQFETLGGSRRIIGDEAMNSPQFSQPQPDENRVTEQEAQAMLELHARLTAHRDTGPTLTDVAEVLRIPESEAKALLERVRAEQSQAAQQQVIVTQEKTTRRSNFRLVTGILAAFLLMFVVVSTVRHARGPAGVGPVKTISNPKPASTEFTSDPTGTTPAPSPTIPAPSADGTPTPG